MRSYTNARDDLEVPTDSRPPDSCLVTTALPLHCAGVGIVEIPREQPARPDHPSAGATPWVTIGACVAIPDIRKNCPLES